MGEQVVVDRRAFLAIALFDNTDRVIALNDGWQQLSRGVGRVEAGCRLAELTKSIPELMEWVNRVVEQSDRREFESEGWHFNAQLIVLHGLRGQPASRLLIINASLMTDEDAYGRLRHDLKNRIGGLKLYATFLKRKLGDQTDLLDVVSKMINSLDQMTAEANKIKNLEGDCK